MMTKPGILAVIEASPEAYNEVARLERMMVLERAGGTTKPRRTGMLLVAGAALVAITAGTIEQLHPHVARLYGTPDTPEQRIIAAVEGA